MKKKGLISVALATVMIVGGLTGCGVKKEEKVTAESLVSNAFGIEEITSLDADVILDVDLDADMSSLLGSDSDSTMNFAINLDCNVQSTKDVAHTKGNATVSLLGTKTKVKVENYSDIKNEIAYNYDEDSDSWTKSDLDSSSFDFSVVDNKFDTDLFDNLTLAKIESKDEDYTVKGTISYKKLEDLFGDELDNLSGTVDTDDLDLDKLSFNVIMTFDRNSKLMKTMSYSVDAKAFNSDNYTINKFEISITLNSINKTDDLSIPKDVTKDVVEEDCSFGGLENDIDSSFGVVSSDSTQATEASTEDYDANTTLAQMYFEKDYIYQDDMESVLVNYYPNIKSLNSGAMTSLITFFNNYTADKFANYLDLYEYWSENDKIALAIMYDLGIVDNETLTSFNISRVDVQSYVTKYVTPLQ